jgi:SAM-dependent methyltransferase
MYGTETSDPVVKYYDQTFAVTASNDIAWYADHAQSNGGRVLDLACGTGRISIAPARAGLEVTAIDDSEGMLQLFRNKLNEEPEPIQSRIGIQQARMESFELPDRFSSIVCCDAFFHNSTVDEQISCLFCVAKHLIPRGSFAFNIPQPTVSFLSHASSLKGKEFKTRGEYALQDSECTMLVEQAQDANLLEQTITSSLRFTRLDAKRKPVATEESSWTTRFTFRYEAVHLLYRCGFDVESLTGDYVGGPVTDNSQLVFVARLREGAVTEQNEPTAPDG